MTILEDTTLIDAPIDLCFELSLNLDMEAQAEAEFRMHAVAGVRTGRLGLGECVTWKLREFGLWITHTTKITILEEPHYFQDTMVEGVFALFQHDHFFRSKNDLQTEMRDELHLRMPWYLGGSLAEILLIGRRVTRMMHKRNRTIKRLAETYHASGKRTTARRGA